MDYHRIYRELIARATSRDDVDGYTEKHHILPKCMGGLNTKDNIVVLTAREHYIAHLLLWKTYRTSDLAYAVIAMCGQHKESRYNSKLYATHRSKVIEDISGKNSFWYGRKHTEETKKKMSEWKRRKMTEEERKRRSEMRKGKPLSEETKNKISEAHKELWKDPEHREKVLTSKPEPLTGEDHPLYGVQLSEEHKRKISIKTKEALADPEIRKKMRERSSSHNNPFYGKSHTEESLEKMRKPRKKVVCPYCGLEGGGGNMYRYHFDNCKYKDSQEL